MNFYIDKKNLKKNGGPYNFAKVLENELIKNFGAKKKFFFPKINIIFSLGRIFKYSKNVVRVDGIFCQNLNDKKKKINKKIFETISKADGVIFQSNFSKKLITYYCKKNYKFNIKTLQNVVISNAYTAEHYLQKKINHFKYKYVLLTITRKSKNKRLSQIIEAFKDLDEKKFLLIIVGEYFKEDFVKRKNIKFLGNINNNKLPFYFKRSDALIHIAKIDSCPNAVVEGLSCGLPVLTNNVGGTKELVQNHGIILNLDKKILYNNKYLSDYRCNNKILSNGIKKIVKIKRKKINKFNPKTISQKYFNFFKKITDDQNKR